MSVRRKTGLIVVGGALVVAAVWVAVWSLNHHVIRTNRGTVALKKSFLSFHNSYVDARAWTYRDFKANPTVKYALIHHGHGDVVSDALKADIRTSLHRLSAGIGIKVKKLEIHAMEKLADWLQTMENYWFHDNIS